MGRNLAGAFTVSTLLLSTAATAKTGDYTDFAFEVYRHIPAHGDDNAAICPFTLAQALGLLRAGARGKTADEIARALRIRDVDGFVKQLSAKLQGKGVELGNALFRQAGAPTRSQYLALLRQSYGADAVDTDFGNPEAARKQINDWFSKSTHGKFPELLRPGRPGRGTRLVLGSAVHFRERWKQAFDKKATRSAPFYSKGNGASPTPVSMMRLAGQSFRHAALPELEAEELPYENGFTLLVWLPKKGQPLRELEAKLDAARLAAVRIALAPRNMTLTMPRFKINAVYGVVGMLSDLGILRAFTNKADFSGIADKEPMMVDEVIHGTAIELDEEGTEAAGATAPLQRLTGAALELTIDRPFAYQILTEEGVPIFMGRVVNPAQEK